MPSVLLLVLSISFGIGLTFFVVLARWGQEVKPARRGLRAAGVEGSALCSQYRAVHRPELWLAVKTRRILKVKSALGLHNAKPCRCADGLAGDSGLFISPPIAGWILVAGAALPDPADDVDACYRFVTQLSRKLGQVQLFRATRVMNHHAWVRARSGRIERAYAWAGETIWQQGSRTAAEDDLKLRCYGYFASPERDFFNPEDPISANVERVPQLAARWSLDPGRLDPGMLEREHGIAGELLRKY